LECSGLLWSVVECCEVLWSVAGKFQISLKTQEIFGKFACCNDLNPVETTQSPKRC